MLHKLCSHTTPCCNSMFCGHIPARRRPAVRAAARASAAGRASTRWPCCTSCAAPLHHATTLCSADTYLHGDALQCVLRRGRAQQVGRPHDGHVAQVVQPLYTMPQLYVLRTHTCTATPCSACCGAGERSRLGAHTMAMLHKLCSHTTPCCNSMFCGHIPARRRPAVRAAARASAAGWAPTRWPCCTSCAATLHHAATLCSADTYLHGDALQCVLRRGRAQQVGRPHDGHVAQVVQPHYTMLQLYVLRTHTSTATPCSACCGAGERSRLGAHTMAMLHKLCSHTTPCCNSMFCGHIPARRRPAVRAAARASAAGRASTRWPCCTSCAATLHHATTLCSADTYLHGDALQCVLRRGRAQQVGRPHDGHVAQVVQPLYTMPQLYVLRTHTCTATPCSACCGAGERSRLGAHTMAMLHKLCSHTTPCCNSTFCGHIPARRRPAVRAAARASAAGWASTRWPCCTSCAATLHHAATLCSADTYLHGDALQCVLRRGRAQQVGRPHDGHVAQVVQPHYTMLQLYVLRTHTCTATPCSACCGAGERSRLGVHTMAMLHKLCSHTTPCYNSMFCGHIPARRRPAVRAAARASAAGWASTRWPCCTSCAATLHHAATLCSADTYLHGDAPQCVLRRGRAQQVGRPHDGHVAQVVQPHYTMLQLYVLRTHTCTATPFCGHMHGDALQCVLRAGERSRLGVHTMAMLHKLCSHTTPCCNSMFCGHIPARRRPAVRAAARASAAGWASTRWPCCTSCAATLHHAATLCSADTYLHGDALKGVLRRGRAQQVGRPHDGHIAQVVQPHYTMLQLYVLRTHTCTATPCSACCGAGERSRLGAHTMAMLHKLCSHTTPCCNSMFCGHIPARRRSAARAAARASAAGWASTRWPCCTSCAATLHHAATLCSADTYLHGDALQCVLRRGRAQQVGRPHDGHVAQVVQPHYTMLQLYVLRTHTCTATPCSACCGAGERSRLGVHTMAMLHKLCSHTTPCCNSMFCGHIPARRRPAVRAAARGSAAGWASTRWPCCTSCAATLHHAATLCSADTYRHGDALQRVLRRGRAQQVGRPHDGHVAQVVQPHYTMLQLYVLRTHTCTATPCSACCGAGERSRLGVHTMAMLHKLCSPTTPCCNSMFCGHIPARRRPAVRAAARASAAGWASTRWPCCTSCAATLHHAATLCSADTYLHGDALQRVLRRGRAQQVGRPHDGHVAQVVQPHYTLLQLYVLRTHTCTATPCSACCGAGERSRLSVHTMAMLHKLCSHTTPCCNSMFCGHIPARRRPAVRAAARASAAGWAPTRWPCCASCAATLHHAATLCSADTYLHGDALQCVLRRGRAQQVGRPHDGHVAQVVQPHYTMLQLYVLRTHTCTATPCSACCGAGERSRLGVHTMAMLHKLCSHTTPCCNSMFC
ncbi:unnamed protein product [Parnassius apollo]|uniref:(apollo) hypothetical protein n=1 Tax=Parnassius apollo TaxID=110799 RepID=A0A8S3WAA3_PARAO|nr:unnamed protein product [Parnassius apollo]